MKLKLNASGAAEVLDGKPVYVDADGKDVAFDAPATVSTIARLNGEAKQHRERAEAIESKFKPFEGLDAEAAKKALGVVQNLNDKKLMEAGEVEKVKGEAIKAIEQKYEPVLKERDLLRQQLHTEIIGGRFNRSEYISKNMVLPPDFVQARFGAHFKVEDGKVAAYHADGQRVFSKSRPGEMADFEEALQLIVESHPQKDTILKAKGKGGGGAPPSGGNGNAGAKTIKRSDFFALHPAQQAEQTKAGVQIVD